MQSDDTFGQAYRSAVTRLTAWAGAQEDAAHVDCEETPTFWRLAMTPHAQNACPVELIVHRGTQTFDLQAASVSFEAQPIRSLDGLELLLAAFVEGDVVIRTLESSATGVPLGVAVTAGKAMFETRSAVGKVLGFDQAVVREQHWVPYRRG